MPNFTTDQLRSIMDYTNNIRNMSVIAHVDHGKSTLTDSLVSKAGIIAASKAGEARFTDTRADEQERCITIKSTGVSMYFEYDLALERSLDAEDEAEAKAAAEKAGKGPTEEEKKAAEGGAAAAEEEEEVEKIGDGVMISEKSFLINLIDSPGHVDFSSEVTAALRVTDGALVVVDCVSGVCVQTETVLQQALQERIKPVLMINKLDRMVLELKTEPEEAYLKLRQAIENVNVVISTYADDRTKASLGTVMVEPEAGTVAFGSGLQAWGFTLKQFAKIYSTKFSTTRYKMRQRLWGSWCMVKTKDPKTGKKKTSWKKSDKLIREGEAKRAFVQFILDPIYQLANAVLTNKTDMVEKMLKGIGVKLKSDEKDLRDKVLLKRIMQKWLPAGDAVLEMIVMHLPSPRRAQKYRVADLYEGPADDEAAIAMRNCDPEGPLMMYVSKMVPTSDKGGRFYAFGRVFSGRIATGQKVRIMGPNYTPGKKDDLWEKSIQRTLIMMGGMTEAVADVPAGNTCGLVGVDQYLIKSGTISTFVGAHNIKQMKYSVSPVVRKAVVPKNPSDLPKLVEGLKRLAKSDPLVVIKQEEGEAVIAGAGELHLEICIKDLRDDFLGGTVPLIEKDPIVSYCETITEESSMMCLSKSANKHNRLYVKCKPMTNDLSVAIENGKVETTTRDVKARGKYIREEFPENGFTAEEVDGKRLWGFGPENRGANLMIDASKAVQYLNEIKDGVMAGFQWATLAGPLASEPVRGAVFRLYDATLHSDSIHRGQGQIMPTCRRVCFAAMYTASPTLMEPIYLAEISVPSMLVGPIYTLIANKRGVVNEEIDKEGTPIKILKCNLPVAESFGFAGEVRSNTGGKGFPQCSFSHYEPMVGDAFKEGSQLNEIISEIRVRKGDKPQPPPLENYYDKL